jgi:cardiolipin synthase A/B
MEWHIACVEPPQPEPFREPPVPYRLLSTVDDAYRRMLTAIERATESVRLEMYIYTATPIGERFRDALSAAAGRGLEVKVLLDAFGSLTLPESYWVPLREAGGSVRWFNPLSMRRFQFRNHRKSLTCDGRVAFVGGFNISTEYEGDGVERGWHDLGLEVHGRLAGELGVSFDWLFERADVPHRMMTRLRRAKSRKRIDAPEGQLLLSGPGWGRNHLRAALQEDMQGAADIQVVSAYFLPPRRIRRALRRAASSGRRVIFLMAGHSDVPVSQLATRMLYSSFLRAGVEIYEYQPQMLHSKLFVFDDTVYAGSANLNLRSLHVDYELMLRISSVQLASQARALIQAAILRSRRIDPVEWRSSRSFWMKLLERWCFFLVARLDAVVAGRQLRTLR